MQNVEKLKNIKVSRKFYVREKKNVEYNGENRPIKWTNAETGESIVMYYDYRGRRCGKLFYNSAGQWVSTAKFFYKDFTLIQESTANNTITKEFVWDPLQTVATRPLSMKCNVQNLNLLYTHDANKNITEVVYLATQNGIGAHYEYSPFGETIVSTRDTRISEIDIRTFNPFRFSSEYHDNELNLIYYNYRHYNSQTGRWISRDPIEESGGTNLYAFVNNNSINLIDVMGQVWYNPLDWRVTGQVINGVIWTGGQVIDLLNFTLDLPLLPDELFNQKKGGLLGYCGSRRWQRALLPDGWYLGDACKAHDECYLDCPKEGETTAQHKKRCDDALRTAIGGKLGNVYGWGVATLGQGAYNHAQKERLAGK